MPIIAVSSGSFLYLQDAAKLVRWNKNFPRSFIIDKKNTYVVVLSRKDMGAKEGSSAQVIHVKKRQLKSQKSLSQYP